MKIICIGRNYAEHARELNNEIPDAPVFFMKPDTCLVKDNMPFFLPSHSNDVHYETELVIKIDKPGKCIEEKFAGRYYSSVSVGFDFTARDVQQKCKEKGLPWEIAKAFDGSSPVGKFISIAEAVNSLDGQIHFSAQLNQKQVQIGHTAQMIFSFNKIISYVSKLVFLKTGDLIFTGTPSGVGRIKAGDLLEAYIGNNCLLKTEIK